MIPTHTLLNLLRNPYGHSDDELRAARLQAAEMIEAAEAVPAKRNVRTAPGLLNMNDKAMWVVGWNDCVDAIHASRTP